MTSICLSYYPAFLQITQKWSNVAILEKRHGKLKIDQVLIEFRVVYIVQVIIIIMGDFC